MIVVVAALKGGVGKTTTAIYLAALASGRRSATLVDADPQASAAEWAEQASDGRFDRIEVVEAPTDRMLTRALNQVEDDEFTVVDLPPAHERLLGKALERATVAVVPTRIGGIENQSIEAVLQMIPDGTPAGLVICSARTFTRDYQDSVVNWTESGLRIWGTVPERVAIAAGPASALSEEGLEAYRKVWRRALAAARSG
jgi:chromosome partitioning protein